MKFLPGILLLVSSLLNAAELIEKISPLQPVRIAYIKSTPSYAGKQIAWRILSYTIDELNGTVSVLSDTSAGIGDSAKVLLIKYSGKYSFYKIYASVGVEKDSIEVQAFSKGSMQKYLFRSPVFPTKPIAVYIYLPGGFSPDVQTIVAMHGIDRNAYNYGLSWTDFAGKNNWFIIAPEFAAADWTSDSYAQGNMFTGNDGSGSLNTRDKWTFTLVSQIERTLVRGFGIRDSSFILWGHSAGGQFVHRMMLFAYDSLIRIAIPANSGWYTAPDSGVIFPWGVQHSLLSISPAQVKEYTNRPMVIMRGTADTVRDANLNVDPLSDAQGKNRYQRAGYFFQKGKNVNPASLWKLVDVVGSGHDYQKMAIAAGTYLLSPNGINRTFTQIPQRIMLQNYPNPFNPSTEIAFSLDHSSKATLELYSLLGQKAATIVDEYLEAGVYRKYFDGSTLSNGTYFCVLRSAQTQATIKLVLIK